VFVGVLVLAALAVRGGLLADDAVALWAAVITAGDGGMSVGSIAAAYPTIPQPVGSFASLAVPALMQNAADFMNCKGRLAHPIILAGVATMWNEHATGPPMSVYVPAMSSGSGPFAYNEQAVSAFTQANAITDVPNGNWSTAFDAYGNNIAPSPTLSVQTPTSPMCDCGGISGLGAGCQPPFILQLTGSVFTPPAAAKTATKVATVALGVPAAIAIGTILHSWATGHAIDWGFQKLWGWTKSVLRQ
jgi:hypothetical protein